MGRGLFALTALVLAAIIVWTPAVSAQVVVSDFEDLQTELENCTDGESLELQLAWDDGDEGNQTDETLRIRCHVDLDLNGETLAVLNVLIDDGQVFTILDESEGNDGGSLIADAEDEPYVAGIDTTNAELVIIGGTVIAHGGHGGEDTNGGGGAGIGGTGSTGNGGAGGDVSIHDGEVQATGGGASGEVGGGGAGIGGGGGGTAGGNGGAEVSIKGGEVHATGGDGSDATLSPAAGGGGAGIGGGGGGGGGGATAVGTAGNGGTQVTIEDGEVTATGGDGGAGIVGGGAGIGGGGGHGGIGGGNGGVQVTIEDGKVTASGGTGGGGIGGGGAGVGGGGGTGSGDGTGGGGDGGAQVTIQDGKVASAGGTGGGIGGGGAGIGGGGGHSGGGGNGGVQMTIEDGEVHVIGGAAAETSILGGGGGGAGIGGGGGGIGGAGWAMGGAGGDGGDLRIMNGEVTARGGRGASTGGVGGGGGSGIGGGGGSHSASSSRPGGSGGEVVSIDAGEVAATGGDGGDDAGGGAGIGGGGGTVHSDGGDGGAVTIAGGGVATARGGDGASDSDPGSAIGGGGANTDEGGENGAFGSLEVASGTLHLPSGVVRVDDPDNGDAITIGAGGEVLGGAGEGDDVTEGATISGSGAIANNGVIALAADHVDVLVFGHHYEVSFDADLDDDDPDSVVIFGPSFDTGYRELPEVDHPEFVLLGWNTEPDGSGAAFDESSSLMDLEGDSGDGDAVEVTLYAAFGAPPVAPDALTIGGQLYTGGSLLVVTTPDEWNGVPAPELTFEWYRCDPAGDGLGSPATSDACTAVSTDASYVVGGLDIGSVLVAVVTATNAAGEASQTTAPTGVVPESPLILPPADSDDDADDPASCTVAPEPEVSGVHLVVTGAGECSPETLPEAGSYWVAVGGTMIGYVAGAPDWVNADFLAVYPDGVLPPGTVMIVAR